MIVDLNLRIRAAGNELVSKFCSVAATEDFFCDTYQVADSTTDGVLNLGSITTVDIFYLYSDQAITYKINGSATAIPLDANGWAVFKGTAITAVTVTNASGSTANLTIYEAGA